LQKNRPIVYSPASSPELW